MTVTGHTYTKTRVRGLAPWSPNEATLVVLDAVAGVLEEYRSYLPMTARQIFYRLVGAHGYDKTENAYKRLLEYLNRGRRAGMIRWGAIRDDGFSSTGGGGGFDGPQEFIDNMVSWAESYERDHQEGQSHYTEIWVEAEGMMPQVSRMVREYHIPIYSSGGFNSVTAKRDTAERIMRRLRQDGRPTRVLHIGDYDPSGVAIIDSLADDIWQFLADIGDQDAAHFVRVAVTPDQIEEFRLPGSPAKSTDRRAGFRDLAVQAEALSPPQLEQIILDEVIEEWDQEAFETVLEQEGRERAQLVEALRDIEVEE